MKKAVALFGRKKPKHPFKDYYSDWINALKKTHLPLLVSAMEVSSPATLSAAVDSLHRHFIAYYEALDLAASDDVAQLLFPGWRNSLEKPFLWLADLHPYLFTNLLRSYLDDASSDSESSRRMSRSSPTSEFFDRPWKIAVAWKNPSKTLMARVDQVECGLRLLVPALVARARDAQRALMGRLAEEWSGFESDASREAARGAVEEAVTDHIGEMTSVVVHANRLRRSVLAEIVSALDAYQAALFFEGVSQFLVGFRDPELVAEFERCKVPLN